MCLIAAATLESLQRIVRWRMFILFRELADTKTSVTASLQDRLHGLQGTDSEKLAAARVAWREAMECSIEKLLGVPLQQLRKQVQLISEVLKVYKNSGSSFVFLFFFFFFSFFVCMRRNPSSHA